MRIRFILIAAAIAIAWGTTPAAAASASGFVQVPCGNQTWETADPAFEALPDTKAYSGKYDGGVYRIEIPDHWNGELVLSAHGFVAAGPGRGAQLRVGPPLFRNHLIAEGYAWAASSYRCNGYVPGQGLLDTMALVDLFTKFNGGKAAGRVYLTGTSMGGHITVLGMHAFPTAFAGGLAMCASGPELFDYFTATSAAAEAVSGLKFEAGNTREIGEQMNAMFGAPPNYTDKGRAMGNIEIDLSGGPRPFAAEGLASGGRFAGNVTGGAASMSGGTAPASAVTTNKNYTYKIDEALGLTGNHLSSMVRIKQPDMTYRNASGPYRSLSRSTGRLSAHSSRCTAPVICSCPFTLSGH